MGHDYGGEPRLVIGAAGVAWANALLGVLLAGAVVALAALSITGAMPLWGGLLTLAGPVFVVVLIWAILPRRFEIYDDRLVMAFPLWRYDIALDTIALARPASWWQSYGYAGVRFATAPSKAVELRRRGRTFLSRPNMVISPADRELFLAELNAALGRYRRLHATPA
jgi:hypothetical protein